MTNEIEKSNPVSAALMEQVVVGGDLASLSPEMRLNYYRNVCDSLGLNPLTKPFEYIKLNGKLVLYARKDATDQLRKIHGISLSEPSIEYSDDLVVVSITARDRDGRTDSDIGAVSAANLRGEARANAVMKAITKAKRRVTLSISGLGFSDESEVESIPGAQYVMVDNATGEIIDTSEMDKLGAEVYGETWPQVRQHNIKRVTDGASLTTDHISTIIGGLNKLKAQRQPTTA